MLRFLVLGLLAVWLLPAQGQFDGWLDAEAQRLLQTRRAAIAQLKTRADAEAYQKQAREKLLRVIGGLPDYAGPLHAKVTGTLTAPTHTIEKVAFESLPGLWITANLYLPKAPGKHPAVLFALGHWNEGKPAAQRMAANLAAKGIAVLAFDPLGQGERTQAYDPRLGNGLIDPGVPQHFLAGTQAILLGETLARYFIWDAKRSIDYLVSHPAVDASRIGVTGCSGGGTQATYIAAMDPRITVAAPLCYMNSFEVLFKGSIGDSEQSLPNFLAEGLDQTDYVMQFAPKPWFIGSTKEDFFTPAGAKVVYDDARGFYKLFDAESNLKWVVGPGGHGTPLEIREGVYDWFVRWLHVDGGDGKEIPNLKFFTNEDLLVTPSGHVAVDYKSRDLVEILRERKAAQPRKADLAKEVNALVRPLAGFPAGTKTTGNFTFEPEPGLSITAHILRPAGNEPLPGVIHVERGPELSARAKEIAAAGAVVIAVVPRGFPAPGDRPDFGDWKAATRSWMIGRSLPGMRAQDIVTAARILAQRPDVAPGPLRGVAEGASGALPLLLAAQVEPRLSRLWLERAPYSLGSALESPVHKGLHDAVIPGFLAYGDLADLASGKRVLWVQPTDWNENVVKRSGPQYYYRYFDEKNAEIIRDFLLQP